MAIWQFDFMIIPQKNSAICYKTDDLTSWPSINISQIEKEFKGVLEFSESWSPNILIYGDNDGTCIRILKEDNVPVEISCRIDLRSLSDIILKKLIRYINSVDGQIYYKNKIYDPQIKTLINLIKNSNENQYCKDPIKYFNDLSLKENKN